MALSDDLKAYIAKYAKTTMAFDGYYDAVMVGETHAFLNDDTADIRAVATVRLLRELLRDTRYRYFANESFQNAGAVRFGVRQYWEKGTLPPAFDPKQKLETQEIGRRVMPRRFQALLDDLRTSPRYILSIGSRSHGAVRDQRLAQHFFEETKDRKLARTTPGVLLLGAAHAAAVRFGDFQTATTRMILEKSGYSCVTIFIITDFKPDDGAADDEVFPVKAGTDPGIRIASFATSTPCIFATSEKLPPDLPSPFLSVRHANSDTGKSLAEQFEYIVLHKG